MQYLVWQDHDPKRSTIDKIRAAIASYEQRFHARPQTVLTHASECVAGLDVLVVSDEGRGCTVHRGNYWLEITG
jgi:hypothetical protein